MLSIFPEQPLAPTHFHTHFPYKSLCPPISVTSMKRPALRVKIMLHFCDFKTAEGTGHGSPNWSQLTHAIMLGIYGLALYFPILLHLVTSSRTRWDATGSSGAEATHPLMGPCQPSPFQALGVAAVPSNKPVPVRTRWALCSQLPDSSPSCCSQETTASPIRLENVFWFNKQRFF